MPRNQPVEKVAWDWAGAIDISDITDIHLETAYRLHLKSCSSKTCKRNCRLNPKCLVGLGEKKWLVNRDDESFEYAIDADIERKPDGSFAGLKNLGATCYVNSLLQVWYHNPYLRKAIYMWKPEEDPKEHLESPPEYNYQPVSPVGRLQLIFGRLQFGSRRYVDPTTFVESLELDVYQQQDAQEFSKLFLTLLEESLSTQKSQLVKNIVQKEYCGEFTYVTRCESCSTFSESPSKFYELSLNVGGCRDITDCLDAFFAPEILGGSNQYYCNECEKKRDVMRKIKLKKLPPVLNLQLLRFVYDRNKKCRRKLNTSIKFPETLDMSKYITNNDNQPSLYNLCAVLVHHGTSAHSGHYIAHIKDRGTRSWFKFNDEMVEKTGNCLKLGSEDAANENENGEDENSDCNSASTSSSAKPPKLMKGQHASNNIYMLVYKSVNHNDSSLPPDDSNDWYIPEYLETAIVEDNSSFDEFVNELKKLKEQSVVINKTRQSEIKLIYNKLNVENGQLYEWISKKWLTEWLVNDQVRAVPTVDNTHALCHHSKLSLKELHSMKCISTEGATEIYDLYGGGPRIGIDSLCRQCVEDKVHYIQMKLRIQNDQKKITSQLKLQTDESEQAYWIGKESLRRWKSLALKQCEYTSMDSNNGSDDSDTENHVTNSNDANSTPSPSDKSEYNFNEDLLCKHELLSANDSTRRLVNQTVWATLKSHFPSAPEFDQTSPVCQECMIITQNAENRINQNKSMALEQKQLFPDLYSQKKRISWSELQLNQEYFALSRQFLQQWQKFVRDPAHNEAPCSIVNTVLLCDHEKLLYPPTKVDPLSLDSKFIILYAGEWADLTSRYSQDCCIKFKLQKEENSSRKVITDPPYCESCHEMLIVKEREQLLNYTDATIYVRKVQSKYDMDGDGNYNGDDDNHDKSFTDATSKKRMRANESTTVAVQHYGSGDLPPRRSSRRRKHRDEKEFTVSSNQKLKDLKANIMATFKVATYDQHLTLNDEPLECNDKTLAQLNVVPNSILLLRVDEPNETGSSLIDDDYLKGSTPETGFKGTQLQKS